MSELVQAGMLSEPRGSAGAYSIDCMCADLCMCVCMQELAPKHAQIHATLDLFPGLTALDLSGESYPHNIPYCPSCLGSLSITTTQALYYTPVGLLILARVPVFGIQWPVHPLERIK